jgi:hypothetical protein
MTVTRTTRRFIFYIAALVFLAVGYVTILYAQGYRYSFADAHFSRTGAVSLRANVQASVLVNGEVKNTTSFLTNSASVGGLLPGTYIISVQKEGYSKWQKKVVVLEGFVQDFSHILLLPQTGDDHTNVVKEINNLLYTPTPSPTPKPSTTPKPTPKSSPSPSPTPNTSAPYYIEHGNLYVQSPDGPLSVATGVTKVFPSEDNQKLIWFSGNQIWLYWLNDQNEQPFHKAGDIAVIGRFNQPIKAIGWFRSSTHIAIDAGGFKIIELDTRGGQNTISL